MDNSKKIILDLCGGTGAWSKPYKDAGYDVRVLTLPEYDITKLFILNNVWILKNKGELKDVIPIKNVYGILAAPTCTHFSLARTTAKESRDFNTAMLLVKSCLEIIWNCRANGNLKFWALENPMGYLRQFLGKPPLTWQPCDYGEPYTKRTDLWGYYNFPKKKPIKLTEEQIKDCSINKRKLPEIPKDYIMPEDIKQQAVRRSITPKGFAKAFYQANN
jgi:hypothetical protein